MADDDFGWTEGEEIIVRTQMAVAVYTNKHGDVVIRQEGSYPDDDVWIVFHPRHAAAIARRILEESGTDPADAFPEFYSKMMHDIGNAVPSPKDRTAAQRQKRHRAKRNGHGDRDVTGETVTPNIPALLQEASPHA